MVEGSSAIAASVTASTRARAARSRRSSLRARAVCLHLHHEAGLGQLLLQFAFLPLQSGDPLLARITLRGCPVAWPAPPTRPRHGPRRHSTIWLEAYRK